jgi:hypothetical protein
MGRILCTFLNVKLMTLSLIARKGFLGGWLCQDIFVQRSLLPSNLRSNYGVIRSMTWTTITAGGVLLLSHTHTLSLSLSLCAACQARRCEVSVGATLLAACGPCRASSTMIDIMGKQDTWLVFFFWVFVRGEGGWERTKRSRSRA